MSRIQIAFRRLPQLAGLRLLAAVCLGVSPPGVRLFEDAVLVGAELAAGGHSVLAGVTEPRFGGVL